MLLLLVYQIAQNPIYGLPSNLSEATKFCGSCSDINRPIRYSLTFNDNASQTYERVNGVYVPVEVYERVNSSYVLVEVFRKN